VSGFHLRSALIDVEHELQPDWLGIDVKITGAHRRLVVLASFLADGGRIAGCRSWSVPKWYSRVGFHPRLFRGLEREELIRWEGQDMVVVHYILRHELRIRGLAQHALWMTETRVAKRAEGDLSKREIGASRVEFGGSRRRVNCAKVHKTPTTALSNSAVQQCSEQTPDPESGSPPPEAPHPNDPIHLSTTIARAGGPGGSDALPRSGAEAGPEGFERFMVAMPVPAERQPRHPRVWPIWRERMLVHWIRHDLEGETEEILAELERRKATEAWRSRPWYVPTGINFLRATSWRERRRVPRLPRKRPAPKSIEVYEEAPWPAAPPNTREEFKAYLNSLAEKKEFS
jgi:hypothetical protein